MECTQCGKDVPSGSGITAHAGSNDAGSDTWTFCDWTCVRDHANREITLQEPGF
jgi:hypothetical protein